MKHTTRQIIWFTGVYTLLRVISFIFPPATPLHEASLFNSIFSGLILTIVAYWLIKKNPVGWYIVAGELFLGGTGNFFSFFGLSLRTALLLVSLAIFFAWQSPPRTWKELIFTNQTASVIIIMVATVASLSAIRGYTFDHPLALIRADSIPYLFFLYYFPLRSLIKDSEYKAEFLSVSQSLIIAAVIGSALFMGTTFALYSSHFLVLQDTYYHWFRDVANGKITALPFNFFRIVLNEQLLLIPLILVATDSLIKRQALFSSITKWRHYILIGALLGILAINITRIYLIAWVIGLAFLISKRFFKRWLTISALSGVAFLTIFTTIHTISSRGTSLGLELFGLRLQSIVSPAIEDSSLSRTLLLPKIIAKIKSHPILGNGLADTVTVYSPGVKRDITTPQFDWGWLEIWAELGIIGLLAWALSCGLLLLRMLQSQAPSWQAASLVALGACTITAPVIFHVLGIVWLVILLSTLNLSSPNPATAKNSFDS